MFEDILEKENYSREEKAILYVIMAMDEMVEMGIFTEGPYEIADKEKATEILEGFTPTEEEIQQVVLWLVAEGKIQVGEEETKGIEEEIITDGESG